LPGGLYSGYVKQDERLGEVRHGPGTLVQSDGQWRMEGLWAYDKAFILVGIKEFNDGEKYEGHFQSNNYDGKVSRICSDKLRVF
jgi:hypothetical protein